MKFFFKLNFFSARRGYRETEYTISAALQSLYEGASLKWSLMTITHEMLHGHVRYVLAMLFFVDDGVQSQQIKETIFKKFKAKVNSDKIIETHDYLDSIRNTILAYCTWTKTLGSLSNNVIDSDGVSFKPPSDTSELWELLGQEYKNISEICVHVLDLHYFYYSKREIYIPLIWASWVEIPHISGDLRQYILRSLVAISSTVNNPKNAKRFNESIQLLIDIFESHKLGVLNHPLISMALDQLNDEKFRESLFTPFKASLLIVDLAKKVFLSKAINEFLYNDEFFRTIDDPSQEITFDYALPDGFNEHKISSPTAFLLDRMTKLLNLSKENYDKVDFERHTASIFISLASSKYDE